MLRLFRLPWVWLLALCLLAWPASAAILSGDSFEVVLDANTAAGDTAPTVRLYFTDPVPPSFSQRTETNGTYNVPTTYFQIPAEADSSRVGYEVAGDLAGTPSLARADDLFDWSSRVSVTVNPFTMQNGIYYRLTVVSNAPSRPSGRRTDEFYFALEHGDAPLPVDNRPPQLSLLPAPDASFAFQQAILEQRGFALYAEDPDGAADLDWASFKLYLAGVDKTAHFLAVTGQLWAQGRVETRPTETALSLMFRPDPAQIMDAHNLFNIAWNGDWPLRLELCDRSGACASVDYLLYFGPFLSFDHADDLRCTLPATPVYEALLGQGYVLGNLGYPAAYSLAYLALQTGDATQLWFYYFNRLGYPMLSADVYPLLPLLSLSGGFYLRGEQLALPLISSHDDYEWVLPSGPYRLLAGVLDQSTGAMRLYQQPLTLCRP